MTPSSVQLFCAHVGIDTNSLKADLVHEDVQGHLIGMYPNLTPQQLFTIVAKSSALKYEQPCYLTHPPIMLSPEEGTGRPVIKWNCVGFICACYHLTGHPLLDVLASTGNTAQPAQEPWALLEPLTRETTFSNYPQYSFDELLAIYPVIDTIRQNGASLAAIGISTAPGKSWPIVMPGYPLHSCNSQDPAQFRASSKSDARF